MEVGCLRYMSSGSMSLRLFSRFETRFVGTLVSRWKRWKSVVGTTELPRTPVCTESDKPTYLGIIQVCCLEPRIGQDHQFVSEVHQRVTAVGNKVELWAESTFDGFRTIPTIVSAENIQLYHPCSSFCNPQLYYCITPTITPTITPVSLPTTATKPIDRLGLG